MREVIDAGKLHKDASLVWNLLKQVLEALQYLHSRNVIHRDLKPSNLFLTVDPSSSQIGGGSSRSKPDASNMIVKLGDFGLATDRIQSVARVTAHRSTRQASGFDSGLRSGGGLDGSKEAPAGALGAIANEIMNGARRKASMAAQKFAATSSDKGSSSDQGSLQSEMQKKRLEEAALVDALDDEVGVQEPTITHGAGTLAYMAPEVAFGTGMHGDTAGNPGSDHKQSTSYGPKVDMYSLGIILFECFVPPFQTRMERAIALEQLRAGTFPREFSKSVPKQGIALIQALLQLDPSRRPSAHDLLTSSHLPFRTEVELAYFHDAVRALSKHDSELRGMIITEMFSQSTGELADLTYDLPESIGGTADKL